MSSSKITREEAEAFRARVKKQNEEFLKNWVIIPIDDAIEMLEQVAMALLEKSGEEAP